MGEKESPIYGDVLESLVSHVPLIDLALACQVSKEWSRAVFSSLRNFNTLKPWLIVHTQQYSRNHHHVVAFDPRSDAWIEMKESKNTVKKQAVSLSGAMLTSSSSSSLLYTITANKFSFSTDPLNITWRKINGPSVCREDPIVALVGGDKIIVVGGVYDFEDDPLAVEMYNLKTNEWSTCQSLPDTFRQSASAKWVSVTVSEQHKVIVTDKYSGTTHIYDTNTGNWSAPYELGPDPLVFFRIVGCINNRRLIMIGLIREDENIQKVKIYEMTDDLSEKIQVIGDMPENLVRKMIGADYDEVLPMTSIGMSSAGETIFLYNQSFPEEIVMCEIGDTDVSRWRSVRNIAANDTAKMGRFVFTSQRVEINDIQRALNSGKYNFSIKS